MIHRAPNIKSKIISKSVSFNGGNASLGDWLKLRKAYVKYDSLVLDEKSRAYTFPYNQVFEDTAEVAHEAYTAKMSID